VRVLETVCLITMGGAESSEAMKRSLHTCALRGDLNGVKEFVEKGASVGSTNFYMGWTPVFCAALIGNLEIVEYLVDKNADVNKSNSPVNGLSDPAVATINIMCTMSFLVSLSEEEKKKKKNFTGIGWTPLHAAAAFGHAEIAKFLIANGARIDEKNFDGDTPIQLARKNDHTDVVRVLLNTPSGVKELRSLIDEFEHLPAERGSSGRFSVHNHIWKINRELARINLVELIRLFRRYPKLIDWSGKYIGRFTFGELFSSDTDIARANEYGIYLGEFYLWSSWDFRQMCERAQQKDLGKDGKLRPWHTASNVLELQTLRHEFGHVFEFLYQHHIAERNPKYRDRKVYCQEFKEFLLNSANYGEWDKRKLMSRYGTSNDMEWFAESFANAQIVFEEEGDKKERENKDGLEERQKDLINEARLVGRFALNEASDFGFSKSKK